uniref:GH16 domain-containing protein n=1 Tax=Hyaloperonospora arabidopsidis (strain Emoy2) TaxID=559515 RepID=M4BNE9_HYAAE
MVAEYPTKSGLHTWVDPDTPDDRKVYTTSRGRLWELVMSDEFNVANRSFRPGDDHMWTSLEKPDGVNGALEIYSHNMTSTRCDNGGNCYFYIKVINDTIDISVYNMYKHPPEFQTATFYYRAAMVQSWNKFCFQGGMLEVRAQLPGAVSTASGNPDLSLGRNGQVTDTSYYPTWPGIWMMGNLGRAIFSASTNRMWPFSYNRCEPEVFDPSNQRINACDDSPGFGLNPNQGRGAPEIDLLEGDGLSISSSLQIAPGMPNDFRLFAADPDGADAANPYCVYTYDCKTIGANSIDVPTEYYKQKRGHKSWYQGLRYAANNNCVKKSANIQSYTTVNASVARGINTNACTTSTCPASLDVHSDLSLIDGTGKNHWGINFNGTCFPIINSYMGSYLCDPDNSDARCASPRNSTTAKSNAMDPFNYQMDAISSNWPVHLGAYTDFLVYQLEWVTGVKGYVRWMLDGSPLFEVTADTFSNVPQNGKSSNPKKVMLEEPMAVIFNVALSSSWGTSPPNAGKNCRGDGLDKTVNKICDEFPMFMKVDYIRLYQDQGDDLDADNYMQVGCDPKSHPTKEWIEGHIDEYQDNDNLVTEVVGKAFCKTDDDCTVGGNYTKTKLVTGSCLKSRCACLYPKSWVGPRCTIAQAESTSSDASSRVYGPPIPIAFLVAGIAYFLTFLSVWTGMRSAAKRNKVLDEADTASSKDPDTRVAD